MEIVRIDAESAPDWTRLRRELWPEWPASEVPADAARMLKREDAVAFLAREGAVPVGFAKALLRRDPVNGCETSPVAFLEGIYVRPERRRRGVARALFRAVEAWATEHGMTEIGSDALLENVESHRMHAALRFAETERVVYFRNPMLDAEDTAAARSSRMRTHASFRAAYSLLRVTKSSSHLEIALFPAPIVPPNSMNHSHIVRDRMGQSGRAVEHPLLLQPL